MSMYLKLDENLGNSQAQLLRDAGYDVETVYSQGMTSASDLNSSKRVRAKRVAWSLWIWILQILCYSNLLNTTE